jgi:hypothetical protein
MERVGTFRDNFPMALAAGVTHVIRVGGHGDQACMGAFLLVCFGIAPVALNAGKIMGRGQQDLRVAGSAPLLPRGIGHLIVHSLAAGCRFFAPAAAKHGENKEKKNQFALHGLDTVP